MPSPKSKVSTADPIVHCRCLLRFSAKIVSSMSFALVCHSKRLFVPTLTTTSCRLPLTRKFAVTVADTAQRL